MGTTQGSYELVTDPAYVILGLLILTPLVVTVPIYVQMTGISCFVIFLGSNRASKKEIDRKSGDETVEPREVLSGFAVFRFPVVASCMLIGLFLAFKYLPKEWVSFTLTAASMTLGGITTANLFSALLKDVSAIPQSMTKKHTITKGALGTVALSAVDLITYGLTVPIVVWYWMKKHWLPNNILSTSLALSALEEMALEDFQSAAILLCGLFFYDIFWVFGSTKVFGDNVMVSVAKQFEGPIKLIFPRFVNAGPTDMSMLGLGDIVIPGFFVALMLRYDESRKRAGRPSSERPLFFCTTMIAYFLGLAGTYLALTVFGAAQPALLYLVPACLLSSLGAAAWHGELKSLISYTEKEEEETTDASKATQESSDNSSAEPATAEVKKAQ